jgi:Interferon-induced transmembrane protein
MTNTPPPGSNGPEEPSSPWGSPPPQPPAGPPPGAPPPGGYGTPPPPPGYQAPGAFGQPVYGRPPMGAKPPNYLVQAILVTVISFFLCVIPAAFGVVSIVFAAQVDGKYNGGDYAGALNASHNAKRWAWVSFWVAIGIVVVLILIIALGAAADNDSDF